MIVKKLLFYLPFFCLLVGITTRLHFYSQYGTEYWLDEIIQTQISKQNISEILETTVSEPHPPGFYFLLKILPVENRIVTRLWIVTAGGLMTLAVMWWGYYSGVIAKYRLATGLAIFFSTYLFLELTSNIKQETIGFPICLLLLFMALRLRETKGKSGWLMPAAFVVQTLLLLIGYVNYFWSLILTAGLWLKFKSRKTVKLYLGGQIIIMGIYYLIFGRFQLAANSGRFSWTNDYLNSLWGVINKSITSQSLGVWYDDMIVFLFCGLVYIGWKQIRIRNLREVMRIWSGIILITLPIMYTAHFFVTTRYFATPFLWLCMVAGWGLEHLSRKVNFVPLVTIPVVLIMSVLIFKTSHSGFNATELAAILLKNSVTGETGFLQDHPLLPFLMKLEYKLDKIEPVNVYFPQIFLGEEKINNRLLRLEGKVYEINKEKIKFNLGSTNLHKWVYAVGIGERGSYYDNKRLVLAVLDENCRTRQSTTISYRQLILMYDQCRFN